MSCINIWQMSSSDNTQGRHSDSSGSNGRHATPSDVRHLLCACCLPALQPVRLAWQLSWQATGAQQIALSAFPAARRPPAFLLLPPSPLPHTPAPLLKCRLTTGLCWGPFLFAYLCYRLYGACCRYRKREGAHHSPVMISIRGERLGGRGRLLQAPIEAAAAANYNGRTCSICPIRICLC